MQRAVIHVVPGARPRIRAGTAALMLLALLTLAAVVLGVVPSGAAPRHASRPAPPGPAVVRVSVGQARYACAPVPPPADISGRP